MGSHAKIYRTPTNTFMKAFYFVLNIVVWNAIYIAFYFPKIPGSAPPLSAWEIAAHMRYGGRERLAGNGQPWSGQTARIHGPWHCNFFPRRGALDALIDPPYVRSNQLKL